MINAPHTQANPKLLVFLPMLYWIWEDVVLTPTEVKTFQNALNSQDWLTPTDRAFLMGYLNPTAPPPADELKIWLQEIRSVGFDPHSGLIGTGIKLVGLYAQNGALEALQKSRPSLEAIEKSFGLIEREVAFTFFPEHRKTITEGQATFQNFDVATMARLLDGKNAPIIHKVKTLLADPAFDYGDHDSLRAQREQVLTWAQLLANQGFGAMAYPKEYGGSADMEAYFAIMETLSYHDLSLVVKFGVQFGLWGMSVYFLGTEKHHRKYLHHIGTLALPGCFAMTETGHGSNVRGIETTATYNHQNKTFTIHTPNEGARKEYIGNAALHGHMATVFAKLIIGGKDYGVSAFVVPLRNKQGQLHPGVTIKDCGRKLGLNGIDNGVIYFNNVVIGKDEMLDRFATVNEEGKFESPISSDNRRFFTMLGTLVGGRIGIPRSGNAASKTGLAIAIRYGDQRRQFGPDGAAEVPILNYRTHQRRLMPLLANAYALHFALQYLTERFLKRTEEEMQEIEALAAGLKSFATWNTTATLQECRESCGGKGYLWENRIGQLKTDSDIYTTFEGDNTVLMQLVAKSRLTEFKQEFSGTGLLGVVNFLAERAATSLSELNPFSSRNSDEDHLLDGEFHMEAFRYRERDIQVTAARRLKRLIDDGMDSFDAFNVCQHHLVEVGRAYVERVILEQFQLAVARTEDSRCQTALTKLCQLFALAQLDKNKGFYLEQGYFEGAKTKAIRKILNQLCWEVRQDAVPLVDAFGVPQRALGEIGR